MENERWPEVGNRVYIIKNDHIVSQTQDLRKLIWYAGKHKVKEACITKLIPRDTAPLDTTARLRIDFADGAMCGVDFASFKVCEDFVKERMRKWRGEHKPILRIETGDSMGQYSEYEDYILKYNIRENLDGADSKRRFRKNAR